MLRISIGSFFRALIEPPYGPGIKLELRGTFVICGICICIGLYLENQWVVKIWDASAICIALSIIIGHVNALLDEIQRKQGNG
jgi:hypothetical protein